MYTRYVNTASVGGDGTTNNTSGSTAAYADLDAALTAEAASLADDLTILVCGTADDTPAVDTILLSTADWTMNGFTITIEGNPDVSSGAHAGVWDDNAYILSVPITGTGFGLRVLGLNGVFLKRFQIENSSAGAEASYAVRLTDGAVTTLDGMIVQIDTNGQAVHVEDSGTNTETYNTIAQSVNVGAASEGFSSDVSFTGTWNLNNCLAYNFDDGFERDNSQTMNAVNCYSFGSTAQDWDALSSVTYSLSEDSQTGTGNDQITSLAVEFTDYANFDFTMDSESAQAFANGQDLSGTFTTDILGETRTNWSIGPFDAPIAAGGGTILPFIMHLAA